MRTTFLATTPADLKQKGYHYVDIVLVSGDGYVDHPSFGIALIGRLLEKEGYKVAVLSQPDHRDCNSFKVFGKPRLFFGISGGNLDSIVSNYTGNGKVRNTDQFSPGGNPFTDKKRANKRRPDHAVMRYSQLARQAYPDVPLVLGGVEASLRRFCHYDYKQRKIRGSVLTDSKADILVYGMGENAVLEIAARLQRKKELTAIDGTCVRMSPKEFAGFSFDQKQDVLLPSFAEIKKKKELFLDAELAIDQYARSKKRAVLCQQQQSHYVVQFPGQPVLSQGELDRLYELPFKRRCHPDFPDIPAFTMIKDSVTIVRGCCGNCSFCAITRHQGAEIVSRSIKSIVREVETVAADSTFNGTVSDLGGPTANLFGTRCVKGGCDRRDCLYPKMCPSLEIDEDAFLRLLKKCRKIDHVRHLFISSGLRMELLLKTPKLLAEIIARHTPGMMKIAPEHTVSKVLSHMHKPGIAVLESFLKQARRLGGKQKKKMQFSAYLITSHPGCTVKDTHQMVDDLKRCQLQINQFQDFTPTPGTIATAMFVSGLDQKKRTLHVPSVSERLKQRQILERAMPGYSLKKRRK